MTTSRPHHSRPEAARGSGSTSANAADRSRVQRLVHAVRTSVAGHTAALLRDIVIMDKALLLAAVSLISFIPLLIVLAAVVPLGQVHDFARTLQIVLGLGHRAAVEMHRLFAPTGQVAGATTAFGLAILAVGALAFVGTLEQSYELIWKLRPASWIRTWASRCIWLGAFLGYGLALAMLRVALGPSVVLHALAAFIAFLITAAFFTWSLHLLLDGRVPWLELLPGGVATAIGLAGLRGFSELFFSPMIVSEDTQYGPIGVVFVLLSWLIGASVVLVGGAAVGAVVSRRLFPRAERHLSARRPHRH